MLEHVPTLWPCHSHTPLTPNFPSLQPASQAQESLEDKVKAITTTVAAKQTLLEQCNTAAASAETDAAATRQESDSKLQRASTAQVEAVQALREAAEAKSKAEVDEQEAAEADRKSQAARLKSVESQTAARVAQQKAASKQEAASDSQREAAESRESWEAAQKRAVTERERAVSALHDTKQVAAALLPLKRALDQSAAGCDGSAVESSSSKRSRTDGASAQLVMYAASNNLKAILSQLRLRSSSSSSPVTIDLQGREIVHNGTLTIPSGVTLRNGSITGGSDADLSVDGAGVVFESLVVCGGLFGVSVCSGGSLRMTACEIQGCFVGVFVEDSGSLQATGLKVLNSTLFSLYLSVNSTANLVGGEVSSTSSSCGICMSNSSSMTGTNLQITSKGGTAIHLSDETKVSLSGCSIISHVNAIRRCPGASLVMSDCVVNGVST